MLTSLSTLVILMITCIFITTLLVHLLNSKKKNQTGNIFIIICILMLSWLIELILQAVFSNKLNIAPIYFDYFVYINTCFLPVFFLLLSISFTNTNYKFNKKILLLTIIPALSLIIIWTNNYHHLFYEQYSVNIEETKVGPWANVHIIYSYILYALGLFKLIKYSIKNAGFFSKQAILILIAALVPLTINLLGSVGLLSMSIYVTPITFAAAILFVALAIFKFDFLKVAPIALQRIVDRISDSYLVVNENNVVTDFNETFLELFKVKAPDIRNKSLEELFKKFNKTYGIKEDLILRFC